MVTDEAILGHLDWGAHLFLIDGQGLMRDLNTFHACLLIDLKAVTRGIPR